MIRRFASVMLTNNGYSSSNSIRLDHDIHQLTWGIKDFQSNTEDEGIGSHQISSHHPFLISTLLLTMASHHQPMN